MPKKESLIIPPRAVATPDGDKFIEPQKIEGGKVVPNEKFWNSHSLFVAGMGAGLFSAILAAFGMAESMQEKGHVIKIEFVFDRRFLHGMIHHTALNLKRNTYGFDSVEELIKLMELLSSQYAKIDAQESNQSGLV